MRRRKIRIIIISILSLLVISAVITTFVIINKSSAGKHYTVVQWLDKVEDNFNLLYYSEQESLADTTGLSDEDAEIVQIAAEWGIIDPNDEIDFNGKLTKELAADTLIRAMNCVTLSTAEISDSNKVNPLYLERVMSSVNEGIFELESGKFKPKEKLTIEEADAAMLSAHDKWVNFSYGGVSFDRSEVKENVINLGGVRSENSEIIPVKYSVEYSGSTDFFSEDGGYTDNTSKIVTFPADQIPKGLAVNSVLAMPGDDVVPMDYAVVVTGITENPDGSVTVSTRKAELEDVFDKIDIQQSGQLDFTEAIFYGPDGKRINFNNDTELNAALKPTLVASTDPGAGIMRLASIEPSGKIKLFEEGDNKLYLSLNAKSDGFGIKIEGEFKDKKGHKEKVEVGYDKTVTVENRLNWHWSWFQIKVDELRLSMTDKNTETIGFTYIPLDDGINFGSTQNIVGDNNENGAKDIGDWASEAHKLRKIYNDTRKVGESFKWLADKANGASNKKLFDVIFPGTPLHFTIRAQLTVEGSIELTLTQENTYGVELVNGKLRAINGEKNTRQLNFSAKAELTFRAGFEFQLIGINVADVGAKAGLGAKISTIVYSYDASSDALLEVCGVNGAAMEPGDNIDAGDGVNLSDSELQIVTDETRKNKLCFEFKLYPILSVFGCSSSSVAGALFGSIELEILGEKNPLFKYHIENGEVVSECSISANDSYGILTGAELELSKNEYAVAVSDEADTGLKITRLPIGSTINDVTITSDDTEILEVEALFHKATTFEPSSVKPTLKITGIFSDNKKKGYDEKVDSGSIEYQFGSWFYDEVSGNSKPQFALTGKKNGTANVTISANGHSVTIPVQVGTGIEEYVSTGTLVASKGTFTLEPGEQAQAAFDFIPEDKTIDDIVFSSSNTSVATVSTKGLITAVGEGDAIITAVLQGSEKEYSTTFTVHVVDSQASVTNETIMSLDCRNEVLFSNHL